MEPGTRVEMWVKGREGPARKQRAWVGLVFVDWGLCCANRTVSNRL